MMYDKDGRDKDGKIGVGDVPRVRPADAVTLTVHHLMLAATYFEATPDTPDATRAFSDEMLDQCGVLGTDDPAYEAGREWLLTIRRAYERMMEDGE